MGVMAVCYTRHHGPEFGWPSSARSPEWYRVRRPSDASDARSSRTWKCNGTGRYAHHGVCFACGGNGRGRIGKFGPARVETAEEITAREASALETLRDIYRSGRSDSDAWEIATLAMSGGR